MKLGLEGRLSRSLAPTPRDGEGRGEERMVSLDGDESNSDDRIP